MDAAEPLPRVVVDARPLKRPGIGYFVVLNKVIAEIAEDVDLVLVTDDDGHLSDLRASFPDAEAVLVPKTTWLWWEQAQVARMLARERADAWIAPGNYGVPLFHPRRTRCAVIVHDLIPLRLRETYLWSRPLWAAMYLVSTFCAAVAATTVVAVSESTASDVRRFLRRSSTIIPPPIPTWREPARAADPPFLLYCGGFDPRKNVASMLDAYAAYRDTDAGRATTLVIIGDRADLASAMSAERGLTDVVEVTGFVDEEKKWDYLRRATAVLYPSSFEGFGIVSAEAFAAGVPVVSGTGGAQREVGGDAPVYVDPASVDSILAGIIAAADPRRRDELRDAGRRQLEQLWTQQRSYRPVVADLTRAR